MLTFDLQWNSMEASIQVALKRLLTLVLQLLLVIVADVVSSGITIRACGQ